MNSSQPMGRCNTFNEFLSGIQQYGKDSSVKGSTDVKKQLFAFLEANDEYLGKKHDLKENEITIIKEFIQNVSPDVEKGTPLRQSLKKVKSLIKNTELAVKTGPNQYMTNLLDSLFQRSSISHAIELVRHDRLMNDANLVGYFKSEPAMWPDVDEKLIQKDPLLAMLSLIVHNNPHEDELRSIAADAYVAQHPEDDRFEKAYVYLKTPHVLLAHLLICSNRWKCANPDNKAFYDEQIAGMFQGTTAFDKGDRLSPEELATIQKQEGEKPRFPIANNLQSKDGYFEVIKWCSTPVMCPSESRLEDLFITSRRVKQESVLNDFVHNLSETSAIVQKVYNLPQNVSAVVAIIGPYGVGKSTFVQQKFADEKPITVYSLDKLNDLLKSSGSRRQDHHFEAMILTNALLKRLEDVPVLLTEAAAIDQFRFNRMVNRDYSSRNRIVIEEIAVENSQAASNRYGSREGQGVSASVSQMGAADSSTIDAVRFRWERIANASENPKIHYKLYLNTSSKNGPVFIEIAKANNGTLSVADENVEVFQQLVPEPKPEKK